MKHTTTNAAPGTPARPYDLDQLSDVLMRTDKVPYGFFVSQALWNALAARYTEEAGDPLAPIPNKFQGVYTVVDPSLAPTEFDVAFSAEAWSKRLAELRQ